VKIFTRFPRLGLLFSRAVREAFRCQKARQL